MKCGVGMNMADDLIHKFAERLGLVSEDVSAIAAGLISESPLRPDSTRVYLDLNHWISLAKALKGRDDGTKFKDSLEFLREASNSGKIVVALSASNYMEV